MLWALAIIGAIIVAYFVVPFLVAALSPPKMLAIAAIKQQLIQLNVEPSIFSAACMNDLAESSIRVAKFIGQTYHDPWRSHLQETAEGVALHIHALTTGEAGWTADDMREHQRQDTTPEAWEILAKHDPRRFSLENLEKTQRASKIIHT